MFAEFEDKAWVSSEDSGWGWDEIDFPVVLKRQPTRRMLSQLLEFGSCDLPSYSQSATLDRFLLAVYLDRIRLATGLTQRRCGSHDRV